MINECDNTNVGSICPISSDGKCSHICFNFPLLANKIQKLIEEKIMELEKVNSRMCNICTVNEIESKIQVLKELHGGFKTKKCHEKE